MPIDQDLSLENQGLSDKWEVIDLKTNVNDKYREEKLKGKIVEVAEKVCKEVGGLKLYEEVLMTVSDEEMFSFERCKFLLGYRSEE